MDLSSWTFDTLLRSKYNLEIFELQQTLIILLDI